MAPGGLSANRNLYAVILRAHTGEVTGDNGSPAGACYARCGVRSSHRFCCWPSRQRRLELGLMLPARRSLSYRQLRDPGLDPAQVYQVRDAGLDRGEIHITLNLLGPWLEDSRASCPSGDVTLQERCELFGNWWKFSSCVANLREVQVHYGVDKPTHHHFSISTGELPVGGYHRNALTGLDHRNLGVEVVQR